MEDVKTENVPEAPQEPAEQTAEPNSQAEEQTPETPEVPVEPQAPAERQVPISVLKEERKKRQEYQRKIAELESNQKTASYDPNDLESVMNHPAVQELVIKQAKQELTDYARTTLEGFPNLHPVVKKAILTNARGFVNENTRDVATAKLDLLEYIEGLAEDSEAQVTPAPKSFQVAKTNVSKSDVQGVRPAEVSKILGKPVDSWSEEETKLVEEFTKNSK